MYLKKKFCYLDPLDFGRFGEEVVDRDVEETLDLAGVQVHGDYVVGARHGEHVGDELGRDGRAALVLLVLARVREAGDDGGDARRRRYFARVDHDQQLHQVVVDLAAARLDDVDVLAAHRLADLDARLEVAELLGHHLAQVHAQPVDDALRQVGVRRPAEDLDVGHCGLRAASSFSL